MKKQILLFAFFTMALIFAGINKSNGQEKSPAPAVGGTAPTCITPTPLNATLCAGTPLAPFVGVPYTYEVTVTTPTGTKSYNWFVTTNKTFISTTALVSSVTATIENGTGLDPHILAAGTIPAASTGYGGYNTPATTGTSKIEIAWKYWVHDPTAPVFLVVYVKNDASCINDNIQVYVIKPIHSFTLDIAPILANGTPGAISPTVAVDGPCASPISSALFNVPDGTHPNGYITVEHGVNYLYYMVTAANFNKSWLPKFQVSGTGIDATSGTAAGGRVVTAIDWQYRATSNSTATWNATTPPVLDATNTFFASSGALATAVPVVAADGVFGGNTGECIVVRVTVANHRIETLAAEPITLAVDGIMYDAATPLTPYANAALGDIHYTSGAGAGETCPWTDLFVNDRALVNIMPRPTVTDAIPNTPNPTDFLPKN